MGCIYFYGIVGIGVPVLVYAIYSFIVEERTQRKWDRWRKTEKDLVILHGYPRAKSIPSASPYPFKVETYLRLTGIKYEVKYDSKDIWGPKGKTPWISLNGKHLGDSEFILDHLNKKFEKDLNTNCHEENLANAQIIRVMLEEFFMWGIAFERLVYGNSERFRKVMGDAVPKIFVYFFRRMIKKRGYEQGVGRHSQEEVTYLMTKYLKSVSFSLGGKKYFGGDELCEEDCGIFGVLAQCLWGAPDSPYEKLMNGECTNLKEYCLRMKEKAWPDWENHLNKN